MTAQKDLQALTAEGALGRLCPPEFKVRKKKPFGPGKPIGQSMQRLVNAIECSGGKLASGGQGGGRSDAEHIKDRQTQDDLGPGQSTPFFGIGIIPMLMDRFRNWCVHAVSRRYDGWRRIAI